MQSSKPVDVAEFRRAIRKGLGRAILMIERDGVGPYREQILDACLTCSVYDVQCEGPREEYLLRVIDLTGDPEPYRRAVLRQLARYAGDRDGGQLSRLALAFARRGCADARDAIFAKFEQGIQAGAPCAEHEVIQLDGMQGLLNVLDRVGGLIQKSLTFRPDSYLWMLESDGLSQEDKRKAVQAAAEQNERVRAYWEWFLQDEEDMAKRQARRRLRDLSYAEIKDWIENGVKPNTIASQQYGLKSWGHWAAESDLDQAARDFLLERRPAPLLNYLTLFFERTFPLPHDRLLDLARADDPEVASAAMRALAKVQSEDVRLLALERLALRAVSQWSLDLLVQNYRDGDARLIEAALPESADDHYIHDIGFGLLDVFEAARTPECLGCMLWVYESGPCETCRGRAVELLTELGIAPQWMLEECVHDSGERIRELAANAKEQS